MYKYRLPKTKNQKKINRKILKFESRYSEREKERITKQTVQLKIIRLKRTIDVFSSTPF